MNKYGKRAADQWKALNPASYEEIENPKEFFSTLGNQIESRVQELETVIAGPDSPGEGYLEKVGRLNMARLQAEEIALQEMIPVEPAEDEEEPDPQGAEDQNFLDEMAREQDLEIARRWAETQK